MPSECALSGAYVLQLLDLVERLGVGEDAVLAGLELERAQLLAPSACVSLKLLTTVVERAVELTGDPALGVQFGLKMSLPWHGFLGFAAMAAPDLGGALALVEQFGAMRFPLIQLGHEVVGGNAHVTLTERVPLGALREFVVSAAFVGLSRLASVLAGRSLTGVAEVTFAKPPYLGRIRRYLLGDVRFEQPHDRLVFPASFLALPIATADRVALHEATQQCELALAEMGRGTRLLGRLRSALPAQGGGFHDAATAAARLRMSTRTLRRQLASQRVTFSAVVDDARKQRATELIASTSMGLAEVAAAVGYSDVANFSRAFRRWTGLTPGSYRRQAR